jgi:ParB family transcriptional regulator, chromosome partitioning protein
LIDEFAMTHEKAAEAVGRSRVAVSNLLRLLSLSQPVQDLLMSNKLDMGHARALIGLEAAQQVMLANKIVQQNLSVRDVENLVKNITFEANAKPQKTSVNRDVLALQNTLSEKIGAVVSISAKASGAGMLKISYSNLDQLDDIIKKITG